MQSAPTNSHGNRGTAATLLAEAGATAPEIAEAMTGTVDKAQKVTCTLLAAACWRRMLSKSLKITETRLPTTDRPLRSKERDRQLRLKRRDESAVPTASRAEQRSPLL